MPLHNRKRIAYTPRSLLGTCGRGGIGRRAALRSLWGNSRGSSSLLDRTSYNPLKNNKTQRKQGAINPFAVHFVVQTVVQGCTTRRIAGEKMTLPRVSGAECRGGRYFLNLRVPPALYDHFGKTRLRAALKTADPRVAEREVMLRKAEFHRLETELARRADVSALVEQLPDDQRLAFNDAGGTLEGLLDAYERTRTAVAFASVGDDYADDRPRERLEVDLERAQDQAALSVLTANAVREGKTLRNLGEPVEIPGGDVTGLRELANAYFEEKQTPELSRRTYEHAVRRFIELHGDVPLHDLTKAHLREYATALKTLSPSRKAGVHKLSFAENAKVAAAKNLPLMSDDARAKAVNHLKYLTSWAPSQGYLEDDPFAGFKIGKAKVKYSARKRVRSPFSGDQIQQILAYVKANRHPQTIDHWAPLLAAYQGARREEIAQMRLCDVFELEGEYVLRITDEGEDEKVKNRSSLRTLPIHPAVVDAGFLKFVQARQCAPDDYLFREERRKGTGVLHDLALDADERVSGKYGKRFAADLKVMGMKRPELVFHSFRHSWEDAAGQADIPDAHRRALAGRAALRGDSQEGYGDGPAIRQGRAALAKVDPLTVVTGLGIKGDR